jgi:hypothetical protein
MFNDVAAKILCVLACSVTWKVKYKLSRVLSFVYGKKEKFVCIYLFLPKNNFRKAKIQQIF